MTQDQQDFINKIGAFAIDDMKKTGILASLTISQAIIESGWGKSSLTVKCNNLFGIKAGTSWTGKKMAFPTKEWDGKQYITINAEFRQYDNWDGSIADHSALLTTAARYKKLIGEKDYIKACKEIQSAGYETAPDYADTLINCIKAYNLNKFDTGVNQTINTPVTNTTVTGTTYAVQIISTGNQILTATSNGFRTPQRPDHDGVDLYCENRAEKTSDVYILAFADGKIIESSVGASVGYYVDILHAGNILTRYFHMKTGSVKVNKGQTVKKGDILGVMGTTGNSTGIHLHFGVKENSVSYTTGQYVNPIPYLTGQKSVGGSAATITPPVNVPANPPQTDLKTVKKVKIKNGQINTYYPTFDGKSFKMWYPEYDLIQVRNDGAYVIGIGKTITAAVKPDILTAA